MTKTINRQSFSVSTSSKNYPEEHIFNHVEFKGLSDSKNDILADASTFADTKNVYVDENNLLVSRAPFKFSDDEGHIIKEWTFGDYVFRLQKTLHGWDSATSTYYPLVTLEGIDMKNVWCFYTLRCISHDTKNDNIIWKIKYTSTQLKINATQLEDKIFFWTNIKNDIKAFNTVNLCFEDAQKYLYIPITNISSNEIKSDFEDENYITESRRERLLYSKLNYINLDAEPIGTVFEVSMESNDGADRQYLYDLTTSGISDNLKILYPTVTAGETSIVTYVEVVETPRATIIMKQRAYGDIQISFDGNFFRSIPRLDEETIGYPTLSKDGLTIIVFGRTRLFMYKLVASESGDFSESSFEGYWEAIRYLARAKTSNDTSVYVEELSADIFMPKGYFESADNFTYVIKPSNKILASNSEYELENCPCVYSEWRTADGIYSSYVSLAYMATGQAQSILQNGEYWIDRYLLESGSALAVSIICDNFRKSLTDSTIMHGGEICIVGDTKNVYRGPFVSRLSEHSNIISANNAYGIEIRGFLEPENFYNVYTTTVTSNGDKTSVFMTHWQVNIESSQATSPVSVNTVEKDLPGTKHILMSKDQHVYSGTEFLADDYYYRGGDIIEYPTMERTHSDYPLLLSFDVWYFINGKIWTTKLSDNVILNLDKYVNCDGKIAIYNGKMPIYQKTLDEHYFAFDDNGKHLLEISSTRHDETDERNFQIYLPRNNEQVLPQKITNLYPISDSLMCIFTEDDIWYMGKVQMDSILAYSKIVRSKISTGCRDGDDVKMAFDGQTLILPTKRGFAAMTPQTLLAESEQSLTYLSDIILDKYLHFYNDPVNNALAVYKPQIKIEVYRYWLLFYKYMSREILVFDTRNNAWWTLETPYPIRQVSSGERLRVIMQIDYKQSSNLLPADGVSFIFADDESRAIFKNGEFPELNEEILEYVDDIIPDTLNGDVVEIFENKFVGNRKICDSAKSEINWHFVSQRLHFGQINNYKKVKSISLNLKGITVTDAKLSTKAFRDMYHPEHSDTLEIKVNDIRTFTKYLNLMHVIDFQYRLENDNSLEPSQFRLNDVSVKYEIKEKIR